MFLCKTVSSGFQRYFLLSLMALAGTTLSVAPLAAAEPSNQWTRFRGENGVGGVTRCSVPLPWSESDIAWTVKLPGIGNGSPVVLGDQVFIMSADENTAQRYLLAYNLKSGEELWRRTFDSEPYHIHKRSSFASGTPCVTQDAVFFSWATPENIVLKALRHDGSEIWTKNLGPYVSQHGYGASPALFGNKLILFNSQQAEELPPAARPGESRVTAFDPATGEVVWETPRTTTRACYGVPALFKDSSGKDALLFSNTGDGLFALDLETGKPLWNKQVFEKRCVSSPIVVNGLAIGTEGSGGGGNILWGVDLMGDHEVKFKVDRSAPYVPTPVAKDDLLFLWGDAGIVTCLQLPTGEKLWVKRIGGNVSTSPIVAGDHLIGISEDGTVTILAANKSFREIGTVKLDETTRATPLASEKYLLIRTDSRLICIGDPS